MTEEQFHQLTNQLHQGDNQLLKAVFESYGTYCLRTLRKKTGCSREDAEDILQDAALVFRYNILAGKLHHNSNLRKYLYNICYNLQRARRQQKETEDIKQQKVVADWYSPVFITLPTLEKSEALRYQQQVDSMLAAFKQLGERCQELLTYFYHEGQDMKTIAQKMGLANTDVVKSNKFRCLQRLREHMFTKTSRISQVHKKDHL